MTSPSGEARVAILVDCDNVPPDILEFAARIAAQFGRAVVRRGYGNLSTLSHRWQEALVRMAFTPSLQFQYASGKNTADIALALDALEVHFDGRADTFCVVTSDSDFAFLCRKLRERGATVCIVGESKTPDALRNASDQFFEWNQQLAEQPVSDSPAKLADMAQSAAEPGKAAVSPTTPKRRPGFVIEAVKLLAADTAEGKVDMGKLGQYLKRADPAFSPRIYGHSALLPMVKTYDLLSTIQEEGGHWSVKLALRPKSGNNHAGETAGLAAT